MNTTTCRTLLPPPGNPPLAPTELKLTHSRGCLHQSPQASALYSSQTRLRLSRFIHVYSHDVRARHMTWVQHVPTVLNAAQWATQDNITHGRKTPLIQITHVLFQCTDEWTSAAPLPCLLCGAACKAANSTASLMLDC